MNRPVESAMLPLAIPAGRLSYATGTNEHICARIVALEMALKELTERISALSKTVADLSAVWSDGKDENDLGLSSQQAL